MPPSFPSSASAPTAGSYPSAVSFPGGTSFPSGADTPLTILGPGSVIEWWRSDLGLDTGNKSWTGQKAGAVLANATLGQRPAYSASSAPMGGRPSLLFDGVDDSLTCSLSASGPVLYYWYIFRLITWALNDGITGTSPTVTATYCSAASPNMRPYCAGNGTENSNTQIGSARRGETHFSGSAADFLKIGNVETSGAMPAVPATTTFFVGAVATGAQCANVEICELFIANRLPTPGERAALDAYAVALGYPAGILV